MFKFKIENLKFKIFGIWFAILIFRFLILNSVFAQEVTILYTGQTHAVLYPCSCPKEPDGGIARRAAKIKELRKASRAILLLDTGSFFAGGAMDENSQNTELDKSRTLVNLKALKNMGYDGLCVADDEFNFGLEFFKEQAASLGIPLLSCNIKNNKVQPFIIKEIKGIKLGIIGVTAPLAKSKAGNLEIVPALQSVKEAVLTLRQSGVDIIVLLSNLSSDENMQLIADIPSVDIIIGNFVPVENELYLKKDTTVIFKPVFQGRRLGKAVLSIKDKKIKEIDFEEIRLSSEIKDDKDILSILPRCFSDEECKRENLVGSCQNAGACDASCIYTEAKRIPLFIIEPQDCMTCNTQTLINALKKKFPGLTASYIKYPGEKSKELIGQLSIDTLPAYIIGKDIATEKEFETIKNRLEQRGDFYLVKPAFGGVELYLKRQELEDRFDVFISLFDKDAAKLLATVKEFNPQVHFLTIESDKGFDAKGGIAEVEEYLRSVCIKKYYPQDFWNYIICRADRTFSSWWEDCCPESLDTNIIRKCARSKEGADLLKENISLNKELQVMFGPAYLIDNNEIFSSKGSPSKEELQGIIKRR